MRKPDEIELYAVLRGMHNHQPYAPVSEFAEVTGERLGIHPKRTWALLYKWTNQGWWEYGVSVRTGWFTPSAPDFLLP